MSKMDAVQADNRKVNRAAFLISTSPDGKVVFDALKRQFAGVPLKNTPEGFIDPNAVVAAAGSNQVIETLEEWIRDGELAR